MQKIPEAPDRKRGNTFTKKEQSWQKKKKKHSLSAVTGKVTTLKSFLLLVGGLMCPSLGSVLANLLPVTAVSVNIQSKYKKHQMDLSNYELKTPDLDKSSQKCLTYCECL